MSESVQIPNSTSFVKTNGVINITTEYEDNSLPNIISTFVGNVVGNQDNIGYVEGELIIQAKNSPEIIDFYINQQGQLILIGSNKCELKGYSIVNGYLIYKTTV